MKLITPSARHLPRGNVLIVVMGVVLILGISLAAVLSLTTQERRVLARTSAWNAALPAAEAGIEEAMSHLRQINGGPRGVNGWVASGSSVAFARTNLNGSRYSVGISAAVAPSILSVGQVWCPSANRFIERRVQVTTRGQGIFSKGIVANDWIKLSGQFESDSFDSLNPLYSTNGMYTSGKRKGGGDIASNKNGSGALEFSGQIKIYGRVATGPTGTIVNSGGVVGSPGYINGGGTGIQSGYSTTDMNVSFPSVTAPYASGSTPASGVHGGVTYKYVLNDSINYQLSTLVLSGSDKILVRGNARLLIDKDVSISGGAFIQIETNANLQLYVKDGAVSMSGQTVANHSGNSANFSLHGLPALKDIVISGDASLLGTIYAPQAKLTMSGGSTTGFDFTGAAIVNQVDASGQYKFHYDEALGSNSSRNLVVATWKEI